jgi:hypothetical protein
MTIQGDKVYFEIKPQEKKKRTKGWLMQMEQKESFICKKFVCINTIPFSKID